MRKSESSKDRFEKLINPIQRTLTKEKFKSAILGFSFTLIALLAFTNFGDKNTPTASTLLENHNNTFSFSKKEFTDNRDQQKYPMIKINNRWWMGKNLNFKTTTSSCYNDQNECSEFGMLYTWDDAKTACPKNWRLPSEEEWSAMLRSAYGRNQKCLNCYASLIENGISGFEGKLGGFKSSNGKSYFTENSYGYYWTGTAKDALYAEYFVFSKPKRYVNKSTGLKNSGFSCRCILEEGKEPEETSSTITTPPTQSTEIAAPSATFTKPEVTEPTPQTTKPEITEPSSTPTIKPETPTPSTQPTKPERIEPSSETSSNITTTSPSTQSTKPETTPPSTQPSKTSSNSSTPSTQSTKPETTPPSSQPTKPKISAPSTPPTELRFKMGSFVDKRNGQAYPTVRINGKWWMAENLNYPTKGSSYYDDEIEIEKHGLLYTWKAAQKACPNGWRLPSDDEWLEMTRYIGTSLNEQGVTVYDYLIIGGPSQFNAVFGGVREKGKKGKYFNLDELGYYWSSTKSDKKEAWFYGFSNLPEENKLIRSSENQEWGLSCRCVRN